MERTAQTRELQRSIQRRKAEQAKLMSMDQRLTAGAKLFDEQLRLAKDMIAGLNPEWDANQVDTEVRRRMAIKRTRDDSGLYRTVAADGVIGQ